MAKKKSQKTQNKMKAQRLKTKYEEEIKPVLIKEFKLKSSMAAPKLTKIVVNMGTGELLRDKGKAEKLIENLTLITGQKPKIQQARVSVAGFSVREGQPVGLSVTLRGERMFDFYDKLVSVVLPRLRDFRGVKTTSFDKHGNYSLGLRDYTVFPEIDLSKVDQPHGLEVTIVTNTEDQGQARRLLAELGMPFQKDDEN